MFWLWKPGSNSTEQLAAHYITAKLFPCLLCLPGPLLERLSQQLESELGAVAAGADPSTLLFLGTHS